MPAPICLLVGPAAGRGRAAGQLSTVVDRLVHQGLQPELLDAATQDAAVAACRVAVDRGAAAVVAVGGDGTVHLAVQALAGTGTGLGVIPAGTGNDFATSLGVPSDPLAGAAAIADDVRSGTRTAVDAGRVLDAAGNQLAWFASILAAGFNSAVNERANRMRWPRGPRRYDVASVLELLRLAPSDVTIDVDGTPWQGPVTMLAVGNSDRYGGGMVMCPDADPTDGTFDLVIVGPVRRADLVRFQPQVYRGTHVTHPAVTTLRGTTVRLAADGVVAYADGERIGPLPLTVSCVPGALQVVGLPR